MAIKIVTINTKGGAGKTTDTLALAGELALFGKRVLLVAVDAHNPGLMTYFLTDEDMEEIDVRRTSAVLFSDPDRDYTKALWDFDLDLSRRVYHGIPKDMLDEVAQARRWQPGKGVLHVIPDCYELGDRVAPQITELAARMRMAPDGLLQRALAAADPHYDYILIDTLPVRPDMDIVAGNALNVADAVFMPLKVDRLTLTACREDIKRIRSISRTRKATDGRPLPILGICISAYIAGNERHAKVVEKLRLSDFKSLLFDTVLPFDVAVGDAPFANELIQLFSPMGSFAQKLPLLAQEVITRAESL